MKKSRKMFVLFMLAGSCFSLVSCKSQNDDNVPTLTSDILNTLPDDFSDELIIEGDIARAIRDAGEEFYAFDLANIDFMTKNDKYYVLLNGKMTTTYESGRQDGLVIFEISEMSYESYKYRLIMDRFYFGNENNKEIIANESYACLKYDVYLLGKLLREEDTKLSFVKNLEADKVIFDVRNQNNNYFIEF